MDLEKGFLTEPHNRLERNFFRDFADFTLRHRGAEKKISYQDRLRRFAGCVRDNGSRRRVGCYGNENARRARRKFLCFERREAIYYQRGAIGYLFCFCRDKSCRGATQRCGRAPALRVHFGKRNSRAGVRQKRKEAWYPRIGDQKPYSY